MKKVGIYFLLVIFFSISGCVEKTKFLSVADPAPVFSLKDLNGNLVSLNDFLKGKELIISFWASWCVECRRQMPILNELYKEYKNKIEIIGINVEESKNVVIPFIKVKGIEYKILLDSEGHTAKAYRTIGVPTHILVNKEGLIKNLSFDIEEIKSYLLRSSKNE